MTLFLFFTLLGTPEKIYEHLISIAYAYDENDRGGSEGNGGVTWYKPFLKKKLIDVFEKEFIEKIDRKLGVKHTVTD